MESNPESWASIIALIAKSKIYFFAVLTAFLSGTVKYVQEKRNNKTPSLKDFLYFSIVASAVTLSALAVMQYLGMEINFFGFMIMFWLGISTDYIYTAILRLIKARAEKIIKK